MNIKNKIAILLLPLFVFSSGFSHRLSADKNQNHPAINKVWIYFKDKGPQSEYQLSKPLRDLSERSIKRRLKVKSADQITNAYDLQVYQPYLQAIQPYILKQRTRSKWLNAVSVELRSEMIDLLYQFEFIDKITPVIGFQRSAPEPDEINDSGHLNLQKEGELLYGTSFKQNDQIGIPALHEMGYAGQNVLICMLDSGFDLYDSHVAFDSLDIVDYWDFTEDDDTIEGHSHGTKTLSVIGGYAPLDLIGPAYKASYLLARTEVASTETPIEEDYWVAGLEWADQKGADIVSSSLGYNDWYTYADMDGRTAVTTRAANIAFDKGILLVNSAGNEGNKGWRYMIAPADAPGVLAIGAVTSSGYRSSFSSLGPTYDGRIKPDLAAMGSQVRVASSFDTLGFTYSNGTSFSCPLAAGAAAVLLSAFPYLTPSEVQMVLKETASQSAAPDTLLGWGIINTEAAFYRIDTSLSDPVFGTQLPKQLEVTQNYPNPFNPSTTIKYRLPQPAWVEINIFNVLGQKMKSLDLGSQNAFVGHEVRISLDGTAASGIYYYQVRAIFVNDKSLDVKTGKMILMK